MHSIEIYYYFNSLIKILAQGVVQAQGVVVVSQGVVVVSQGVVVVSQGVVQGVAFIFSST